MKKVLFILCLLLGTHCFSYTDMIMQGVINGVVVVKQQDQNAKKAYEKLENEDRELQIKETLRRDRLCEEMQYIENVHIKYEQGKLSEEMAEYFELAMKDEKERDRCIARQERMIKEQDAHDKEMRYLWDISSQLYHLLEFE